MSRFSGMSPKGKRTWLVGTLLFFLVIVGMIAYSQWYAMNVNVPNFQAEMQKHPQ